MPTNVAVSLDRPYMESAHVPARKESALRAVHHLLDLEGVELVHKKELLSIGLWKWTEAEGFAPHPKYHIRLRSLGSIDLDNVAKVNHEHVWTRSWIVGELLKRERWSLEELREFLKRYAVACIVTIEEHARLSQSRATGWQRYADAAVPVWDMLTDLSFDLTLSTNKSTVPDEDAPAESAPTVTPGISVEDAITRYGGAHASNLRRLLSRMEDEEVVIAVGRTREGGVGDYLRIHDVSTNEPSPAVAYVHWNGKVSVRLQPAELPTYLVEEPAVRPVAHKTYGVNVRLEGARSLNLAEELVTLALEKVRAL